jgi:ferredoxin-NADP reductase
MLGIKYYDKPSSFKMKLGQLEKGEVIHAGALAGEFTLPTDWSKKLVFIAGGIGVTPFRSMVKYMTDMKEKRDVVLLYSNKTPSDVAYKNIFDEAGAKIDLKTLYFMNDMEGATVESNMRVGFITPEVIMKEIPDYKERMFYISGPHVMSLHFKIV